MPSHLTLVIRGRFGMFLHWNLTLDKCTLKAYQEFCHDLSFSESKRNHNDTPDDGRLIKALWSVTCVCRQRQSETTAGDRETHDRLPLPNFYAEMKRRGKNLSNLQEFAKSINYLLTHKYRNNGGTPGQDWNFVAGDYVYIIRKSRCRTGRNSAIWKSSKR